MQNRNRRSKNEFKKCSIKNSEGKIKEKRSNRVSQEPLLSVYFVSQVRVWFFFFFLVACNNLATKITVKLWFALWHIHSLLWHNLLFFSGSYWEHIMSISRIQAVKSPTVCGCGGLVWMEQKYIAWESVSHDWYSSLLTESLGKER